MHSKKMSREEALNIVSKASLYGNLGLFIGAGMSMAILNDERNKIALSWKELINDCAKYFDIDIKSDINIEGKSYPEIASEIAMKISTKKGIQYQSAVNELKENIANITCWYPESSHRERFGKIIQNIDPNWIITTNYDLIIECLLTGNCISLGPNDQLISPKGLIPVYHLHGTRTNPNSIIITQEDYIGLFRHNQYRQQKLSLSIKESTTLIIGYGLGDVNVLTALDWAKNVYSDQRINYPHDIIQLLYTQDPKDLPYRDKNEILIIEFNDLASILEDISSLITKEKKSEESETEALNGINDILKDCRENHIKNFIDDPKFRIGVIKILAEYDIKLISGFLVFFSKSIEETWNRSIPNGAFDAYNQNLIILLDLIENIELSKFPPALLESVAYNLNSVSSYIGKNIGQSYKANNTWESRKKYIPSLTKIELINISNARKYEGIKRLLNA